MGLAPLLDRDDLKGLYSCSVEDWEVPILLTTYLHIEWLLAYTSVLWSNGCTNRQETWRAMAWVKVTLVKLGHGPPKLGILCPIFGFCYGQTKITEGIQMILGLYCRAR